MSLEPLISPPSWLVQLERDVVALLLDKKNDPDFIALREQYGKARITKWELSGAGFFTTYSVPADAAQLFPAKSLHLGNVQAELNNSECGFVLHVKDGCLDYLEGFSYADDFPNADDRVEYKLSLRPD